mmetsp:Transcript_3875/g.17843  ORF Transcript_3875/g.17843 Transcript_3875/m.17843 type:complete len:413 (-) Transcript_3875:4701-5939(-)
MAPSAATRPAFLSADAMPFLRSHLTASSMSPLHSVRAFLQSIMPAPDLSRSSFTALAETALISARADVLNARAVLNARPRLAVPASVAVATIGSSAFFSARFFITESNQLSTANVTSPARSSPPSTISSAPECTSNSPPSSASVYPALDRVLMVTVADCAAAATFLAASSPVPPTTRIDDPNDDPLTSVLLPSPRTSTTPSTRLPPCTPCTVTGIANPSGTVTAASPPPVYTSKRCRRSPSSATNSPPAVSTAMRSSPSPATPLTVTPPPRLRTIPTPLTCICLSTFTRPPAVSARRTSPKRAPTSRSPPSVCTVSVLPTSLPTRTSPPSVAMAASAVMVSARTDPPAVCTFKSAPRMDPNPTFPPHESTRTADSTTCAMWTSPPPVVTSTPQKRGGTRHRRLPRPRGCMSA